MARQSRLAWACLAALAAVALWFWEIDKRSASVATMGGLLGCLGLILPPRERMAVLPARIRTLPRRLDAAPVAATLLTTPGYGLNWFYGANPYDEAVHLLNGALLGLVLGAALLPDGGSAASAWRLGLVGAAAGLLVGIAWEVFEWLTGLIGAPLDTASDIALTAAGVALGAAVAPRLLPDRR